MATLPSSRPVTYEEWLRMPEVKGITEEVIHGEIRHMPAPSLTHAKILQNTYDEIRPQLDRKKVWISTSQFDLIIRRQPLTTRQPDFAMSLIQTMVEKDGRLHSPP